MHWLKEGEMILWQGEPCLRKNVASGDLYIIVTRSLGALALCLPALIHCIAGNGMDLLVLFLGYGPLGLLFWPMILYDLCLRQIAKRSKKKSLRYFVTDRRAVVLKRRFGRDAVFRQSRWRKLTKTPSIAEVDRKGIGTIYISRRKRAGDIYLNTGLDFLSKMYAGEPVVFYDIEDCRSVFAMIERICDGHKPRG